MNMHTDEHLPDFQILATGLVYTSVCSAWTEEETTRRLNLVNPTGLSHGWTPATDKTFVTGQPNPCRCEIDARTHVHRLYVC